MFRVAGFFVYVFAFFGVTDAVTGQWSFMVR